MKRTIAGIISCLAVLAVLASASAATQPNYRADYNTTLTAYQDLTTSAQFHNQYAKSHKGKCGNEKSKAWVASTKTDIKNVTNEANQLVKTWKANHGKRTYRDSLKAARDVTTWGQNKVQASYGTCKSVPVSSSGVDTDLNNVANDLGIPKPYNGVPQPGRLWLEN